jgi:hypothetical protein
VEYARLLLLGRRSPVLEAQAPDDLLEPVSVPAADEQIEVALGACGPIQRLVALPVAVVHPFCGKRLAQATYQF